MGQFFEELKRRNVLRVAIAYVAASWLLIQVVETLFPVFGLSDALIRLVAISLFIGFPLALIFSWLYELTPDGLKLEKDVDRSDSVVHHTGKKLDRAIIIVLTLSFAYFAFDKFLLDPARDLEMVKQSRQAGAEQAMEEARLGMWNEKSIAVLPFINHSMQQEDESFTNGMHDELLTRLARIAALKVISRTSVMRYRDTDKSLPEIAKELAVATILEGGVQRSGNQVRINVQLINAHTDEHLWGEIFDRTLTAENLFAIQSEITSRIAAALNAELSPREESRIYSLPTSSLEAYSHYMRGRQLLATGRVAEVKRALQAFERAVDIDPEFALAWVGIADSNRSLRFSGADFSSESVDIRRRAIEKALELDDQLGEAYVSLSQIYHEMGKFEETEAACNKSIELSPNYSQAYLWCAWILEGSGPAQLETRLAWYYKAAQLDPRSLPVQIRIGAVLQSMGRYDEALDQYNLLLQLDPGYAPAYASLGSLHEDRGRLAEAIQWYRKALQRNSANGNYMWRLTRLYLSLGDIDSTAGIRETMDARLDPKDWRFIELDWTVKLAQGALDELPAVVDRLAPAETDDWWALAWKANSHLLRGDLQKGREYSLRAEPGWANPDQWQRLISASNISLDRINACNFAGILMATGDEALGRDLLRQTIHYYEDIFPGLVEDSHRSPALGWCYLVEGSFEKALEFYEQRVAHGHISTWWSDEKWPWWEPLRDDPRYIAMVNRIDGMLAEQRELLRQMDEAGEPHQGS